MKIFSQKFLVLAFMMVICSGELFAQVNWTKYPGNPILVGGPSGSWNHHVLTSSVLYNPDSLRYEMWFTASQSDVEPLRIGFAKSVDGIIWIMHPTWVLSPTPGTWDQNTVEFPCVIRENGQYKMWYAGASQFLRYKIGYATSTDGINWTKYADNPIFGPGVDFWEAGGVHGVCVMPVTGGYKIWYEGYEATSGGYSKIGYATSVDEISWIRDTQHNPILGPGTSGQWDDAYVFMPFVLHLDGIYYLYYGGANSGVSNRQIGVAVSQDGITQWLKNPQNPVLPRGNPGEWDDDLVQASRLLQVGDSLYMWYTGDPVTPHLWKIGLAKSSFVPLPLATGTYTIGAGGNFATIQDAFNKLSTDGIAGNVTFELIDNLYTAPTDSFGFKLAGPIRGAGPNSRVTIKPASNKNVTIEGGGIASITFLNTRYLTIDGVGITGPTTLRIHSLYETPYKWALGAVFYHPSSNNIVQNVVFENENYTKYGVCLAFMSFPITTATADSNLIQNNYIKKGFTGIYISGRSNAAIAKYNIVRENVIGSDSDSLITWGIQIERNENSIIENNLIENISLQFDSSDIAHGINICGCNYCIVRNNVVHRVRSDKKWGSTGILLSGSPEFGFGNGNLVYNNMVYDIQSTSSNSISRVAGIQLWYQRNPRIYYNSVNLSGTGGTCPGGSAALFITWAGTVTNLDVKNNIFVNTRDESPYCASTICDYSSAIFTSDYNDLFYEPNQYNCLVRIGVNDYHTLADWQVTGKDIHSITEMPNFILPNLHVDFHISTSLDGHATPIPGITADIDAEARNEETPDIGADEIALSITFSQLSVNVINGWNMVSIPGLNSPDQNVNTWWPYRDMEANVFKYANGYQSVTTVLPRTGYWMKHAGIRTYNTGEEWPSEGILTVTHSPIPGNTGWNLIGGYELSVTTVNLITNPPGQQSGPIYKYSGGYQVATTLDPGYGYWIKLLSAAQIIIPETLAKDGKPVEYFPEDWGRIILTDAAGRSYTLYAANNEVDLNLFELPPAPPAGMFDIRFSSGRIVENLGSGQIIEMSGVAYPVTIKVENMNITLQDESGQQINIELKAGGQVKIDNSTITKFLVLSGKRVTPIKYALEQNYPNPFNPSTTIKYTIPKTSKVKLTLFNLLGEEVTTLVNEEEDSGNYSVEFNASSFPSGVYFYQLRAGDYIDTKKMMLIK